MQTEELRKAAVAVFAATDENVAQDIAGKLNGAADEIDDLRGKLNTAEQTLDQFMKGKIF